MSRKIVFFDLETGGLEDEHPVIQIGAVAAHLNDLVEIDCFERKLFFDEEQCTEEALQVNCYHPDTWIREGVEPKLAVWAFADWLDRHKTHRMVSERTGNPYYVADLAGHNAARFDGEKLKLLFDQTPSRNPSPQYPNCFLPGTFLASDTLQLALWFFKRRDERPEDYRLSTLCEWFGLPAEQDVDHDALAGARAALSVAHAIILKKGVRENA